MNDISNLKDKYLGKRIFIIGNGPSLNQIPLEMLSNEYTIAMNRISLLYQKTKWYPSFFVCTSTNIQFPDWHRDIMRSIDMGIMTFAWDKLEEYIGHRKNVYYVNCDYGEERTPFPPAHWWSDDVSKRICKYGTSMLVAFQLVFYMGFKDIYIIGADLGFRDSFLRKLVLRIGLRKMAKFFSDKNHFSSNYDTPGCPAAILNRNMLAAHKLTKRVAEKQGVNIFNATPGGQLEVYPRVNFPDLFDSSSQRNVT